jgi:hypothetical protein
MGLFGWRVDRGDCVVGLQLTSAQSLRSNGPNET